MKLKTDFKYQLDYGREVVGFLIYLILNINIIYYGNGGKFIWGLCPAVRHHKCCIKKIWFSIPAKFSCLPVGH